jgi:hypothetical protein
MPVALLTLLSPAASVASTGFAAHKSYKDSGTLDASAWIAIGVGVVLLLSFFQPTEQTTVQTPAAPSPPSPKTSASAT